MSNDHSEERAPTSPAPRNGVVEEEHRAGIGVGEAQQHSDQGGLAGTIRTEVAEGAAAGDGELNVVGGDVLAESLGQPVGLDRPLALGALRVGEVGKRGRHPMLVSFADFWTLYLAGQDSRRYLVVHE
jgi:hypothetical protein